MSASNNNHLPHIVLESILNYATAQKIADYRQWKPRLQLLGVCQQWRALAKTMVYKTLIFQSRIGRNTSANPQDGHTFANSFNGTIANNIQLIKSVQAINHTTEALVYMCFPLHFNWLFSTLLVTYHENTIFWAGVKTLRFTSTLASSVHKESGVEKVTGVECKDNIRRMLLLARLMLYAIPNIEHLYLRGEQNEPMTKAFFDQLQSQYAKNLQSIDNILPAAIGCLVFPNITSLNINFDNKEQQTLPQIYRDSLKFLHLAKVSADFSWSFFKSKDTLQPKLVFPKLYCLDIAFVNHCFQVKPRSDPSKWRLTGKPNTLDRVYFPKLKILQVMYKPEISDLCFSDVFSKHLSKLRYSENATNQHTFAYSDISSIDKLTCFMKPPQPDTINGLYHETNYLLDRVEITQHAFLEVSFREIQLQPKNIRWTNLTDMDLSGIQYHVLVDLLTRTPSLVSLSLSGLKFNQLPDVFDIREEYAELIKVKYVYVFGSLDKTQKSPLVDCICHLALCTRSLKKLGGTQLLIDMVIQFVDENRQRYPHLGNLGLATKYNVDKDTRRLIL
ncbi:hypothetical protein H4R99_000886 [Coemansia sp. RSA 1722]|nr:hypothetical protein LPJ57_001481 [Coemansia sp. RSA 486]KAJ2230519.1 hypothetical protein IWW45_005773 [Coemansia sp. RSA 485]KAJ2605719.1 hypothetical protein H4R99_000886 [Coemansia sp. RSA 1722]